VLVELEGHGREDLFEGLDLSRTVGWFTTRFPVCLTPGDAGPGEAIQAVKEQLRRAPKNGIGYGLLRYLNRDPGVRMALTALPSPEVMFNYLGQLDLVLDRASLFTPAKASAGLSRDLNSKRLHLLDVNIQVDDRRLCIDWTYPSAVKNAAVIEALAHHYVDALRNLIAHCSTPEAGGVAPSDFPEAGLTDAELSDLLKEIG
jgi:non-ribosomal peptide synthase protein (TIGR01720 family)